MTNRDKTVLINGLKKLSQDAAEIAALLESDEAQAQDSSEKASTQTAQPEKVCTYEEARAALAEKARTGFRAEVKAILTAHGLKQLSDAKDLREYAAIVTEAEEIGDG